MNTLPNPLRTAAILLASSLSLVACTSTPLQEAPLSSEAAPVTSQAPTTAPSAAASNSVAPVTTAGDALDAAGPTAAERIVYFDYDSTVIRPEFRTLLDAHARYLVRHTDRRLRVGGHSDERGGREYNLALGQERAEAVRRALQLLGVSAAQVEAVSFGEEKPVAEGHDEESWAKNRRAELAYR